MRELRWRLSIVGLSQQASFMGSSPLSAHDADELNSYGT